MWGSKSNKYFLSVPGDFRKMMIGNKLSLSNRIIKVGEPHGFQIQTPKMLMGN